MDHSPLPFAHLKVVELANVLAGPAVGMFFAELGAEVIKVENATTDGDMTRHWKLPQEASDSSVSAYFSSINYKKSYLRKNLSVPEDLAQVKALIASADIVVSNFRIDAAERFGLDAACLTEAHPRLIHAHLAGFVSSPDKVAFDVVLQAETGFLSMSGSSDGQVAKMPVALIDVIAAHQLKEGILLALLHRERTGQGGIITSSLEESALTSLVNQASNYLMTGHIPRRIGSLHPNIAPYGELIRSSDDVEFVLAIGTDRQFGTLADWLGDERLREARFTTNQMRLGVRKELLGILQEAFSEMDSDTIGTGSQERRLPIGRINNIHEVLETDTAERMLRKEVIDGQETQRLSSIAFQFSPTP